ncbi:IMV membrane protein [Hypsugopox virus]|nr:IMV membrane protein [Hypsugopox virus]
MDKLYASIFGVFISSADEDFNEFIDVVKSVISDEPVKEKCNIFGSIKYWMIFLFVFVLFIFLCVLYLKVVRVN